MSISLALIGPGAIPDLDTLKTLIEDWLDRDDLDDRIPWFISMFEAEANRKLRTPQMEKETLFSADREDTPLPSDYLAMRALYVEGSPDSPLRAFGASALRMEYEGSTAAVPSGYVLVSEGIRLVPPPAAEILLHMDYFQRIEPLSVVAPSNWLLERHPDAYLYGALFYAEAFLDNAARASQWRGLLDGVFADINRSTRNDRFGAGALVPNATRQVRGARS